MSTENDVEKIHETWDAAGGQQSWDYEGIFKLPKGLLYKVTVHWDGSYAHQSYARLRRQKDGYVVGTIAPRVVAKEMKDNVDGGTYKKGGGGPSDFAPVVLALLNLARADEDALKSPGF